jgi:hypothetical protein
LTWGSAALHPRLYAVARSAGWGLHPLQQFLLKAELQNHLQFLVSRPFTGSIEFQIEGCNHTAAFPSLQDAACRLRVFTKKGTI